MHLIVSKMKTLIFIRHAKSSWDHDVSDLKRPLNKRGFTDAHLVSKAFAAYKIEPDAVFSSPANRALTTCQIFMETLGWSQEFITINDQLYDFGGNPVRRFIKSLDDNLQKVMIFGHNHAFTTLVNSLGDTEIDNLPTSGVAMIEFKVSQWQQINQGHTTMILTPKDFK